MSCSRTPSDSRAVVSHTHSTLQKQVDSWTWNGAIESDTLDFRSDCRSMLRNGLADSPSKIAVSDICWNFLCAGQTDVQYIPFLTLFSQVFHPTVS